MSGLRICYIAAPGEVGGLERVLHGQALGCAEAGHDVHVIAVLSPEPQEAPFSAPLRESAVRLHELRVPPGIRHFPTERAAVRRLLESVRPDVVHTHGFRSDILDGGIARALGIPSVTTIHGESFLGGRTAVYEWLQWRAYRHFDAVIAVSAPLAANARRRRVPAERLHLVPNAWPGGVSFACRDEARRALGLPPDRFVCGWLARMIPVKGADVLLRAAAEGLPPEGMLCLIGDGSERPALEALAAELGLADRVRFAGSLPAGAKWLPAFDAFVLSSRSEGTPIAVFEAMAAGLPIIATAVGGVPDMLTKEVGWLVPADDSPAMAAALRAVAADSSEAARRGAAAKARLEEVYGTRTWIARHESIYRALHPRR